MAKLDATVFVIDDDEAVCRSLSMLVESLNLRCRCFPGAQEFLNAYDASEHGCLVLDVRMPGISGLELQQRLLEQGSNIPVIFITGYGDVPMAVEAMRKGSVDFIEKPFREQVFSESIQKAIAIDAENRRKLSHRQAVVEKQASLTQREREVLDLLVAGKSSKTVAYQLNISQKTVDFHRLNILEKMGVESVVELVLLVKQTQ
jgi:FixJ family two-component response regulator